MTVGGGAGRAFTLAAVVQAGRLGYEALLLVASLRAADPGFAGRVVLMEPQPGPLWPEDPRAAPDVRAALQAMGAEIVPFESRLFGAAYPHGNKIEGLAALPPGPFLFVDTDTVVTGRLSAMPFDFARPTASLRRSDTWPKEGRFSRAEVWGALYRAFGLDFASSQDAGFPAGDWRRYLYFNAGWFCGADPGAFGRRFAEVATAIRGGVVPELAGQVLDPWLDQAALPLVIHGCGGGRPGAELAGMDGDVTCHWRLLPLLYAREPDAAVAMVEAVARDPALKPLLRGHAPVRRFVYQGHGGRVRAMFDRSALPGEAEMRRALKAAGLWAR
jgi:hypothetical protein